MAQAWLQKAGVLTDNPSSEAPQLPLEHPTGDPAATPPTPDGGSRAGEGWLGIEQSLRYKFRDRALLTQVINPGWHLHHVTCLLHISM